MTEQPNWVAIERTYNAPIDLVWKMWAEAEHFASWYGPQGASIPTANMDVKTGGSRLICMEMQTPNGEMQMWFTGEFTEVTPMTRLVYTDIMCDENGTRTPPEAMGMPAGTDMSTSVVVELEDLGGSTKMMMTHIGVPADSPGGQGWAMAFEKLDAAIAA
jgi:uncharacterized protein YndB with AHSA1/START domain